MDEQFHQGIAADTLRRLSARKNAPGVLRLTVLIPLLVGSGAGLVLASTPWAFALSLAVHSVAQLACFGMLHESVHKTAFKSRWLNSLAAWIASVPQLMAPALMREFHFAHHRHTHDLEADPELAGVAFMANWPRGPLWLANASGLPLVFVRVVYALVSAIPLPAAAWALVFPFVRANRRRSVAWSSRALLVIHGAFGVAVFTLNPLLARVYLGTLVSHALLALYITCEHRGLPAGGTILERTRTFNPGPVVRWIFWNMPYHGEHHAYPAVPFHALPQLHEALQPQLVNQVGGILGLYLRSGRPGRTTEPLLSAPHAHRSPE